MKVLKEMTAGWYMFGCAMKISTTDLDIIENKGTMERYMKDMLEEWLKTGSATWEKLQEALRSVGNKRLAGELEKHKLKNQQKRLIVYKVREMPSRIHVQTILMVEASFVLPTTHSTQSASASVSSGNSKYMCQAFYQRRRVNMWKTTLAYSPHHISDVSVCIL